MAVNGDKPDDYDVIVKVLALKVPGEVKWYSLRKRYGFIQRIDTNEDVFVHRSGIEKFKRAPCLWRGLKVECSIVETNKGVMAQNVTGPNGEDIVRPRRRREPNGENGVDEEGNPPRIRNRRPKNDEHPIDDTYYDATAEGEGGRRGNRRGRGRGYRRGVRSAAAVEGEEGLDGAGDNVAQGEGVNSEAPGPRRRRGPRYPRRVRRGGDNQGGDDGYNNGETDGEVVNKVNGSGGGGNRRRRGGGRGGYMNNRGRDDDYYNSSNGVKADEDGSGN